MVDGSWRINMSCYHPLTAISLGQNPETGKTLLQFIKLEDAQYHDNVVYLPCGRCIGCRMDYSRHWADRMMLELDSNNGKGIFLTLTYDCKHLVDAEGKYLNQIKCGDKYECLVEYCDNGYDKKCDSSCEYHHTCNSRNGSLYKRHLQLFMKSLRKELDSEKYGYTKVRFFACGEYGDWKNSHRPHYHVILYGLDFDSIPNKKEVGISELRQKVFTAPLISRHWPHGFISFGNVSWQSCAYVARYVTKKALDPGEDLLISKSQLNPCFTVMSRKPGIGAKYLEAHPDCLDTITIPLPTKDGKRDVFIPRYFVKKLELTDKEKYDKLMADRMLYAQNSMLSKLNKTDLPFMDYLEVEEKKMYSAVQTLKRHKVRNNLY